MCPNKQDVTERDKRRALPWFLAHSGLNAVFAVWTFGSSVFLLFLDELRMPKEQIGVLLSLFPFCGILALGFAPVAARLGRKRVFLTGYGVRKLIMAGLLFLPWFLAHLGRPAAVAWLFGVIAVFALLRALAETAYYPWSQEFIPNSSRGRFSATSAVVGTLSSCVAVLMAGRVLGAGGGLGRFLALIGAGCVVGVLGVACMARVPGGAPAGNPGAAGAHRADMARALRDGNFLAYLGGAGCATMGSLLLISFLPLYAKEQMGIPASAVVRLDAVMMIGGVLASLLCGWAADRIGSRPVLMPTLALGLLVAIAWVLAPRRSPHAAVWAGALYFTYGIAFSGVATGSLRLLFNGVVPPERNTAYTAIYYAWLGLTGGMAPLLAGGMLGRCAGWRQPLGPWLADGHALLFLVAAGFLGAAWVAYACVRPDGAYTTRGALRRIAERCGLAVPGGRYC